MRLFFELLFLYVQITENKEIYKSGKSNLLINRVLYKHEFEKSKNFENIVDLFDWICWEEFFIYPVLCEIHDRIDELIEEKIIEKVSDSKEQQKMYEESIHPELIQDGFSEINEKFPGLLSLRLDYYFLLINAEIMLEIMKYKSIKKTKGQPYVPKLDFLSKYKKENKFKSGDFKKIYKSIILNVEREFIVRVIEKYIHILFDDIRIIRPFNPRFPWRSVHSFYYLNEIKIIVRCINDMYKFIISDLLNIDGIPCFDYEPKLVYLYSNDFNYILPHVLSLLMNLQILLESEESERGSAFNENLKNLFDFYLKLFQMVNDKIK